MVRPVHLGEHSRRHPAAADEQDGNGDRSRPDTKLDLLWPLIQSVPQTERTGAIKGDSDLPIRTRSYRKWFREIADAAEIPHSVWNMEARAGGVTEALEAGASLTSVQRAATHSNPSMTQRYDRSTEAAVGEVAAARKRARTVK